MAFRMADAIGFSPTARGNLGIVVTEAATNLLKHAGGGEIILRDWDRRGVEVLAVDRGPGMRSVAQCQVDGFSTSGSPGTGLGAITRLSSGSEIYSVQGAGTIVQAFCESGLPGEEKPPRWDIGSIISPLPGEVMCGDAASFREKRHIAQMMLVDGLGHGALAAEAAQRAKEVFERATGEPRAVIEAMHDALHNTRGAAAAVLQVDTYTQRARYCGVGNISGVILTGEHAQHMISMNGILGHQMIRPREFEYAWSPNSLAVMYSDGISSRWQISQYPGLTGRRASVVAAAIFRDHRKSTDDASVLAGKQSNQ